MKRMIAAFLVALSLMTVCSSAFAATRNIGSAYCQMKSSPTQYIYSEKNTSSTKVKNVSGLNVQFNFLAGSAYWANARYATTAGTWTGYVPLSGMKITVVTMRNMFFTNYTLKSGDSGTAIKWLQAFLNQAGYSVGTIDGIWGNNTQNAVIAFQQRYGLTPNGLVENTTKEKLLEETGLLAYTNGYE